MPRAKGQKIPVKAMKPLPHNLHISCSKEVYDRLKAKADAVKAPSVGMYLLQLAGEYNSGSEASVLVQEALREAAAYRPGKPFRVPALFDAEEWENVAHATRIHVGRQFHHAVTTGQGPRNVQFHHGTACGHKYYVRTVPPAKEST